MSTPDAPSPAPITPDDFRIMLGSLARAGGPPVGWHASLFSDLADAYAATLARAESAEARAAEMERERDVLTRYRIARDSEGSYRVFRMTGTFSDRRYETEAEAIDAIREYAGLDAEPGG